MNRQSMLRKGGSRPWRIIALGLALLMTVPAWAQRGGGQRGGPSGGDDGPRMSREDLQAVWRLQADHAATQLSLDGEQADHLRDAYSEFRRSHMKALRESLSDLGDEQGDQRPRERFRAVREAREQAAETELAEFRAALSNHFDASQTENIIARLGVFSRQWDPMVNAIRQFNLGERQAEALELANDFVMEEHKRLSEVQPGEFRGLRSEMRDLRSTLDASMAQILSEEQLKQWNKETRMGRRGRPEGRRGGPRPGNPPPGGPPPNDP